jgi:hypothetical protein
MNNVTSTNSDLPLDSEASLDPTQGAEQSKEKSKPPRRHRLWGASVGLLLTAALVLFAWDRLGVERLGDVSVGPAVSLPSVDSAATPAADPSVGPVPQASVGAPASSLAAAVKPPVAYGEQQSQIQALIAQVASLPTFAQPPKLTQPVANAQPAQLAQPAPAPQVVQPGQSPQQGQTESPPAGPSPAGVAKVVQTDPLAGPSLWSRLADSLSELFVVHRLSASAQPLLDERGDRLARQELRLLLLSARLSLMMGQSGQAKGDLTSAQALLSQAFRSEDPAVQAFAQRVVAIEATLPSAP